MCQRATRVEAPSQVVECPMGPYNHKSRNDTWTTLGPSAISRSDRRRPCFMTISGKLLAWIESRNAAEFVGAFVGEDPVHGGRGHSPGRAPATQVCSSRDEARQWVEEQAAALALPVKWVSGAPRG
jgi:hypothetical protein